MRVAEQLLDLVAELNVLARDDALLIDLDPILHETHQLFDVSDHRCNHLLLVVFHAHLKLEPVLSAAQESEGVEARELLADGVAELAQEMVKPEEEKAGLKDDHEHEHGQIEGRQFNVYKLALECELTAVCVIEGNQVNTVVDGKGGCHEREDLDLVQVGLGVGS